MSYEFALNSITALETSQATIEMDSLLLEQHENTHLDVTERHVYRSPNRYDISCTDHVPGQMVFVSACGSFRWLLLEQHGNPPKHHREALVSMPKQV